MADSKSGVHVCVTGGTGYLGSWLIMRLLQRGYSVHTTIRGTPDTRDVSFLTNLDGASERLTFFNAEFDKPESFKSAIEGCEGVFHVAHPMEFDDRGEGGEAMSEKSIKALLGILKVCSNSKSVKRVLYTSSDSAVVYNDKGLDVVDEESWSDADFIKSLNTFGGSYSISKTLTEKAAHEFAKENGLDLVCVNPGWIHGPFITSRCPDSVQFLMSIFSAGENVDAVVESFETMVSLVHVDDVVNAHIFLFEYPDAKGRYICCAASITPDKLFELLAKRYPQYKIPTIDPSKVVIQGFKYPKQSSQKLIDAGFKFKHGPEEIYDGALECCKQRGLL